MPNNPSKRTIPHLHPEVIAERDAKEALLCRELNHCWMGDDFDQERANHLLCGYATQIFDIEARGYRRKSNFSPSWLPEIVDESIHRILICADKKGYPPGEFKLLLEVLQREIQDYIGSAVPLIKHPDSIVPLPSLTSLPTPQPLLITPQVETKSKFSEELEKLLEEARWKPEDIAEKIGIDPRNVYRHLASQTAPSLTNTGKYEAALSKRLARKVILPVKRQ
jgi:hypothetical protein